MSPCTLELSLQSRINLAAYENRVPLVRELRLTNGGEQVLHDLTVSIEADPPFAEPWSQRLVSVQAGGTEVLGRVDLALSPSFLRAQRERALGQLRVRVMAGEQLLVEASHEVELLAPNEWSGVVGLPELLAAFVQPNHRALAPVLKAAARILGEHTGSPALDGYQSRSSTRVHNMVAALYKAVQDTGLTYINPPASFERTGQKVATHGEVLGDGLGTCLDLTVLLAALMERVGLHPLLIVVDGHAFPGVWLTDFSLLTPAIDDPAPIRKRLRLEEALVFDSSAVASGASFPEALSSADKQLGRDGTFLFAVDVHRARSQAHRILPLELGAGEVEELLAVAPAEAPGRATAADLGLVPEVVDFDEELELDEPATAENPRLSRWKSKLLDLTLRNRLLNFKERVGTVPMPFLDLDALGRALLDGQTLRLGPKPAIVSLGDPRQLSLGGEEADDAFRAAVSEEQAGGRLCTSCTEAELRKRLLELHRRARSSLEETGAVTLYLAVGFLRWFESPDSKVDRYAPLLLVPVELVRGRGVEPWSLRLAEAEVRVNETLLKKLEEFGLSAPELASVGEGEVDVGQLLKRFTRLVMNHPRWEVVDYCALSQVSFTKFLMWRDLEAHTEHLLSNPVVRHIFEGAGEAYPLAQPIVAPEHLDARSPPATFMPVVSADPSQLQAILATLDGSSFVLQGPPGTGKSQTITNLVATLLAEGRSVLFVSEKMAALEVVHSRLEAVGLGPFCLELHSHQVSKRAVMAQLAAAFEAGGQRTPEGWEEHARRFEETRDELNGVAAVLRAPTPFGLSTQAALSRLIGLSKQPLLRLPPERLPVLEEPGLNGVLEVARGLAEAVKHSGSPGDHPWRGTSPGEWTPGMQRRVEELLTEARTSVARLKALGAEVETLLGLPAGAADSRERLGRISHLGGLLRGSPAPPLALVSGPGPEAIEARTEAALDHLSRRNEAWNRVSEAFTERLLQQDLDGLRARFAQWGGAFFLLAWVMLWGARSRLKAVSARGGSLPASSAVLPLLDEALETTRQDAALQGLDAELRGLYGRRWAGLETDAVAVRQVAKEARAFRVAVTRVLSGLPLAAVGPAREHLQRLYTTEQAMVAEGTDHAATLAAFVEALAEVEQRWGAVVVAVGHPSEWPGGLEALEETLARWRRHNQWLRDWTFTARRLAALDELGLEEATLALSKGELEAHQLASALERGLLEAWWEQRLETEPLLRRFRGVDQEDRIGRFHELDARTDTLARQVVAARVAARVPALSAPGEEMATLRHQLGLKQRHMALRQLFTRIPNLLRRLKPCVLMSPLSVAQFLDPSLPGFDVVVFDEASQIPPWDAIGAIARGSQVVIVGDSKQLPPTSFFHAADDTDEPLDDEDRIDLDSILEEAVGSGLPQHRLAWHYRSRHESLIAFSNHHYYDGRLRTFPGAEARVDHLGVHLHPVPDGFYDRGASRTNRAEAEAVLEELRRLLSRAPEHRPTVGVVTFSMPQQRLIEDLCDQARAEDPELDEAFGGEEAVFVKNLENVQGDERDVILFSVGYGPDRAGKLTMNFGPLNRDGGERRLNVAITRARQRVVVFSTLRADQIDLSRTRALGVAHLKTYLAYAERGISAIDAAATLDPEATPESPLEAQLKAVLEASGHRVHCQVGVSGYRLDLAVVHPDKPGSYVLGVECDGATYHSSVVARERDRLRQLVLEGLGWRIHRVWSPDWWHEPQPTRLRLLAAIEAAIRASRADELARTRELREAEERRRLASQTREEQAAREAQEAEAAAARDRFRAAFGDGAAPEAPKAAPLLAEAPKVEVTRPDPGAALDRIQDALSGGLALEVPPSVPRFQLPTVLPPPPGADFYDPAQRGAIAAQVADLVRQCGPIEESHAWQLVRGAWGFGRLGSKIRGVLEASVAAAPSHLRPSRAHGALWGPAQHPPTWTTFRVPGDPRDSSEIPLLEVANAHAWVLDQAGGVGVELGELSGATSRVLGFSQLGKRVRERMEEGAELLVELGRARREGERLLLV